MWNIIGLGEANQDECLIHDSNIKNHNRIIVSTTSEVVKGCHGLGIAFYKKEEDANLAAVQILKRQY